ncbi:FAD/NAD(P)-binding protein [Maribacter sp. BPC-D8]|uniref:FAD/NAD(P)-binding protein n=1 Tax=Maribacter sp. BPC-D8 TaxID=3053613 RepID=UPI002B481969|nr:FAD/NAD(P)-binding protein [Maribacter sp. BPC-D8]WRI30000.1 FAD/NAD(P)-binding protein [Maribacter sp. BPC-D8]
MDYDTIYKIGIIGFGPKGFYGFERLIAYLNEAKILKSIEVHIFNNTAFLASGDVYRTDQPAYLIMNYANRNINSWVLKEPFSIASSTPDFVTWLTAKGHAEAAAGKYAPRALVGSYLADCYQLVLEQLPKNVKVFTHIGKVTDMIKQNENYQVFYTDRKSGEQDVIACNNALFTTGHHSFKSHKPESVISDHKIDFIYPTDQKLSPVTPQSLVAIKGFGLTAIDAILALTEGKGGTFKKNDKGILKYIPSEKEPYKIYTFSRTGLPMVPRNGSPTLETRLQFFTKEVVQDLKGNKPISFNSTLLPIIQKEFYYAFYSVLFKNQGHQFYYDKDFTVMENQAQYFHEDYPETPVFNWETIVNPFKDEPILSSVVLQVYVEFLIDAAKLGEDKSPFMAAVATWRKISPIFNELYSFGGLDAESQKEFDTYYFGLFNRLSYGPPVKNMQKILALCKAGILDFSYVKSANVTQNSENNNFTIQVENGQATEVNYLINATIARAKESGFENELYQNLSKNGLIREFENTNYMPGCLEINDKGNPVSGTGIVNKDITFYGTPTEGITCDNDTLSRTRNDFATDWAKETCTAILKRDGRTENYDRTENVL